MAKSLRFLRLPAVKDRTGLSRSFIYSEMDAGRFPKQVPLGAKAVAWVEDEITAFQEARIAARDREVTRG
jgi:prophage regulatory protein